MTLRRVARDEITFPGKVKKYGTGYFIPLPKEYMDLIDLDGEGLTQFDVIIRVVARPVEEETEDIQEDSENNE